MGRKRRNTNIQKFTGSMQKKLTVLFFLILAAFLGLTIRLYAINRDNGEEYKKQVLSQQEYDSIALPAKRGEIIDRNGTKIAVSQKVYNVIVDSKSLNDKEGQFLEPTLNILFDTDIDFLYTREELKDFILSNPTSQYRIVAKKQEYETISPLMEKLGNKAEYPNLKGVWLENTYQREYPYGSLACDVIGFVQGDNEGAYGLEEYYNTTLVGTDGREYGYLNDDENLERTIKSPDNGKTLVTSIDVNIQSIVEKHILAFNEEHENEYREGAGSKNTGVIIMNPNTGEILAMASYPVYDLNNPRDITGLDIQVSEEYTTQGNIDIDVNDEKEPEEEASEGVEQVIDEDNSPVSGNTVTAPAGSDIEEVDIAPEKPKTYEEAYEDAKMEALNALWKNFCITTTYEPGSTYKPFTMAAGIEEGIFTGNETFNCTGVKEVGDHEIHCNNRLGHGQLTFSGALEQSCNVAFMDMGARIGKTLFMKYNRLYNFGLKTNVDLTGEALTNTLVFDVNRMVPTDLAISSFGQGFNVTMIQMISGFCSLINGGYYYQPHIVTRIINDDGATVKNIEPRVIKQTVSAETSEKMVELCNNVVSEGTGKTARPAGYRIGGKTGTAEKYPRKTGNYVVSFMGYAPADDPQIVIYTVIDTPNVESQPHARYATLLTRDILTEVLPYMHVFMTEELTDEEKAELDAAALTFAQSSNKTLSENTVSENSVEEEKPDDSVIVFEDEKPEEKKPEYSLDPATGYPIDPATGAVLDPSTGQPIDPTVSDLE
ncbi:MAG: cell division protein FtsI [Lachnospiraceae bacterium]|nr:cell division protein FtsI [Lachnospiraceae bacterium]